RPRAREAHRFGEPSRVLADFVAATARFHAEHFHARILEKCVKKPDRIGTAADARNEQIGEPALGFKNLAARLFANDFMEIAHHLRIGMSAENRSEEVMCGTHVGEDRKSTRL